MPDPADAAMDKNMIRGGQLRALQRLPGGDGDQRQGRRLTHG